MKILISSSFKFANDWPLLKDSFQKAGFSCLTPQDTETENPEEIIEIKKWFFKPIDETDILYVYNPNGYIGKAVMAEIGYAKRAGKKIFTLEKSDEPIVSLFSN